MSWDGFYQYAGNEVINVARTEAYAKTAGLPWFKPVFDNDSLAPMLGERYVSPSLDTDTPWTDPDAPESYDFYGAYPISITGIEDSTRTSTLTQNVTDGGFATTLRHGTKSPVFNVVLIGETEAACEYGMRWLKQSLLAGQCDTGLPDLCYLSAEPQVDLDGTELVPVSTDVAVYLSGGAPTDAAGTFYDGGTTTDLVYDFLDGGSPLGSPGFVTVATDPSACLTPLLRSLHQVQFNTGPTVTAKYPMSTGGVAWNVTFSGLAQEPWEYGAEVGVIQGFLDPAVTDPWVGGLPDGAFIDLDGALFVESSCTPALLAPLEDPLCPVTIAPPLPPSISLGCFQLPANWRRRQITIPKSYIPLWGEVVPKFEIHADHADVRYLRLRFYADPDGDGDVSDDPCAFCGDIVVSYIPQGYTLVFDSSQRQVYVEDATHRRRRADAVVSSADGTPFDWPVLTCGTGYVVTLDLPQTQVPPTFDLSLFSRAA